MGLRRGAHLPDIGRWARRWIDHWVCDTWPVRRQTYGYLPSRRASPPFGRYQIILLGDRGTWVWTTCPELLLSSGPAGSRTRDLSITSQCLNHWATKPPNICWPWWLVICLSTRSHPSRQLLQLLPLDHSTAVLVNYVNCVWLTEELPPQLPPPRHRKVPASLSNAATPQDGDHDRTLVVKQVSSSFVCKFVNWGF